MLKIRGRLPWFVPRKYFDLFLLETVQLPKVLDNDIDELPPNGKQIANGRYHNTPLLCKKDVRAYLASIAFLDTQIGRVLDIFEKSIMRKNTVLIFMSDHGYHLGQTRHWLKNTLWEESTRIPYIWVVPGMTKPGSVSHRTVDLMSLYPTLMDLCGLSRPLPEGSKQLKSLGIS